MGKEKLAVSIMNAAMRKRTIAQALWEEADKDIAKASQMLQEASKEPKSIPLPKFPDGWTPRTWEEAKDAETLPLERS